MRFFYSRRDEDKLPRIVRLFFAGLTLYRRSKPLWIYIDQYMGFLPIFPLFTSVCSVSKTNDAVYLQFWPVHDGSPRRANP